MDMKRTVIPHLHDNRMNFHAGMKISLQHKNRNSCRYDSRPRDILCWYHVNEYRAIRGNRSELAPGWKSPRCHVNTPLVMYTAILKGKHIYLFILLALDNPKQRKHKFDWLKLLCFRGHHICFPSSMSVLYILIVAEGMSSKEEIFSLGS